MVWQVKELHTYVRRGGFIISAGHKRSAVSVCARCSFARVSAQGWEERARRSGVSSPPCVQMAASPGKQPLPIRAAVKLVHHHICSQECALVWVSVDNPDSSPPKQLIKLGWPFPNILKMICNLRVRVLFFTWNQFN